ncbi:MAG: sensor histidine kinase, partial [Myxococcales bacterium]
SMSEPNHGRVQTDKSLRAERGKTDTELATRRDAVDRSADAVVLRARDAADEVLQTARDTADGKGERSCTAAVTDERALADDVVETARSDADESVRHERAERRRALAGLLRLEREQTDQHLLTERGFSDEALSTRDIFLAMVSHDLRTLLGGIAMNAEMLAREAGGPGDANAVVLPRAATIQRLTARMNRLIGDLVDVASIEAGKLQVTAIEGDLRALVHESVEIFQAPADARGIRLEEIGGPPLLARFDHDRSLQVVANLIGNAIKFSPPGARISVRAEGVNGEMRVAVSDTGPGIPAENLEAIFGRFWQVGRRDRRGLGLGLYISRCIVEAQGGRIWAENGPGSGSTFIFTVPAP